MAMQQVSTVSVDDRQVTVAVRPPPARGYRFAFHGTGGAFFVLILKNLLLTLVTAGLYAAWAKTERRKYLWQNTEFNGQRLVYTGTGPELFVGYLKVAGGYLLFFGLPALLRRFAPGPGGVLQIFLTIALLFLIPFAVYWSRAYLLSRTSWRGVRFSLEPGAKPFAAAFIRGYLLTLMSLGLYAPVWLNQMHKITLDRTRFGNVAFRYEGEDRVVWGKMLRGWFLSVLTLGIYYFWYRADLTRYQLENTYFDDARGSSALEGGELFSLGLIYIFGTTLTFGIAFPWVACHALSNVLARLSLEGNIDFARIAQAPAVGDAVGDGLADAMDLGLSL
jgi:uncharacterized membrane protein YjgN (DUF898 family)